MVEILAPVGSRESLEAALAAGADAVYLGLDEGLNARARAANFPLATLRETADEVHRAGARLFLTMNTLVFESELAWVEAVLRELAAAGVDALIVQDPAVCLIARAVAPGLHLHASTQMTVSSPEAARFAAGLGVVRVVVPRELSTAEIARFTAACPLEVEVFVHGALCMSWSGQCLTSEAWGGRSANRGQCAQSCRLPYELVVDGEVRPLGEVKYLLSPLDLAGARAIPALLEAGVKSLKIEGRLKGPAYVASAVTGYRRWRDAVLAGQAEAAVPALVQDLGRMATAYSRGFSDGFLAGSDHQDLVEGRFPKHRGRLLGEVVEVSGGSVRVAPASRAPSGGAALGVGGAPAGAVSSPLPALAGADPGDARGVPLPALRPAPGMGVGFDTGRPEAGEPGGPLFGVEAVDGGWWLRFGRPGPDLRAVRPGHKVWITSDPAVEEETRALLRARRPGRVGVALRVSGAVGAPLQVSARVTGPVGVGAQAHVEGPLVGEASGAGLTHDVLVDKLGALGGTPFRLDALDADDVIGRYVPVASLKAVRRALVEALEPAWLAACRHAVDPRPAAARARVEVAPSAWTPPARPVVVPLVRTPEQLDAVVALGFPEVELDWMELVGLERAAERARSAGLRVGIATVRVQKPGEEPWDRRIARLRPDSVLVRHWGGLVAFGELAERPVLHGDFSLNVTNSVTGRWLLAQGLDTLTPAHDNDEAQVHALLDGLPPERVTVTVHHHIPTFHTEHCVYAHTLSRGRDFRTCGRPCERHRVALRDPRGLAHPVVVDVGCRNTVFNATAQAAAHAVPGLLARGVRRCRVELVWESREEAEVVLSAWQALLNGASDAAEVLRRVGVVEQFGVSPGTMATVRREGPVAAV